MNTCWENLEKLIEAAAIKHQEMRFNCDIYNPNAAQLDFTSGANFALPLGREEGFKLAVEWIRKRNLINKHDYFTSICLEEEGKRLGILK